MQLASAGENASRTSPKDKYQNTRNEQCLQTHLWLAQNIDNWESETIASFREI